MTWGEQVGSSFCSQAPRYNIKALGNGNPGVMGSSLSSMKELHLVIK